MKTLRIISSVLLVSFIVASPVMAEKFQSLRGDVNLDNETSAPPMKSYTRDHAPDARNYVQQPPTIPHKIAAYKITKNHNKCMDCHSWQRYREAGATKISLTHFKDRAGTDLARVSPLRYFCNQCHVPQHDAKPLVENTFSPVEAVKQR